MADYTPVPRTVPSSERTTLITDVEAGDRLDLREILGRSARGLQMFCTDDTDEVTYRLNNLLRTVRRNPGNTTTDYVWSTSDAFPVYSSTGELIELTEELSIGSIEIVSLTLGTGTTIEIVVW